MKMKKKIKYFFIILRRFVVHDIFNENDLSIQVNILLINNVFEF